METNQKLTWSTKLIYGVGDVGNAVVNSAIQFFLMIFYTDGALIAPALAANALLIGKIWDAVNDPLFGWLSDRTSSRFGKRRVYMIFGALPLAISIMLLWFVPKGLADAGVFIWIVLTFMLFDTVWTMTNVPYYALSAELTDDYDERAGLTASRMILGVPAYIVGAALTPALVGLFAIKRLGYGVVGVFYGLLAAVALWVSAAGLKERKEIQESKAETPPLKTFMQTFKNRPFVRLLVAYLIANVAFALIQTLLAYFLTYQLRMEDQVPVVMFLLLIFIGIFLFPWKMLAERWNKGPAYALGLAIGGLAVAATFFLPHEPTPWVYVIACVAGVGFSAQWVFPWAMVPDVVEYDRLESGEHRSGMYFGVWGLATKVSGAIGIAASGWVLQIYGYAPNIEQSAHTLFGIRLFFGPAPLIFLALALPLLIWYPITRARHAEIKARLATSEIWSTGLSDFQSLPDPGLHKRGEPMRPIRVAIVGCGRIAGLHQMGYRGREDARIAAVCDVQKERACKMAAEWGVDKIYTDYARLLADPQIDLVELLVPHSLHAEMTAQACQAGKHVSVQKPMAMNVAEADRMIAAAEQAGVTLRVYENFVFYPPHVRARQMIEAGEIGEPQVIRLHVSTGMSKTAWEVPVDAWRWRFQDEKDSGGVLVFDHGYHLFSLAYYLMGAVERVYAWIDRSPVDVETPMSLAAVDAPATIMFQFKSPRRYGLLDFAHTPNMLMDSIYYADDDRVEVIGDRGVIIVNRCTARTLDLPPLMLFRDGRTQEIPVERYEWHDSFIDCTRHLVEALKAGGEPVLDGPTGKAVLQFVIAAHLSAREGREVRPDEVVR